MKIYLSTSLILQQLRMVMFRVPIMVYRWNSNSRSGSISICFVNFSKTGHWKATSSHPYTITYSFAVQCLQSTQTLMLHMSLFQDSTLSHLHNMYPHTVFPLDTEFLALKRRGKFVEVSNVCNQKHNACLKLTLGHF